MVTDGATLVFIRLVCLLTAVVSRVNYILTHLTTFHHSFPHCSIFRIEFVAIDQHLFPQCFYIVSNIGTQYVACVWKETV